MSLRLAANQSPDQLLPNAELTLFAQVAQKLDLFPATDNEIEIGLRFATESIGGKLTPASSLQALQRIFPSVVVYREEGRVTGIFAYMLIRPQAMDAVWRGQLDVFDLDLSMCAGVGEPIGGAYSLGFAGLTKAAGKAVVACANDVVQGPLARVPTFTRAATPVGRHIVVDKLGYSPLAGAPDIFWLPPAAGSAEAAA